MAKKRLKNSAKRRRPGLAPRSRFFLPWPYIFLLLLCVGALLIGWTFRTSADETLIVKARVPAEPLSEPALITSPINGQRFTSYPIVVSGTCPLDSYIKLYRNAVFSGTAICSSDKTFQLSSDLFLGGNSLQARVFNITDDEGPESDPVTVYLDQAAAPAKNPPAMPAPPFVIKTDFRFIGYRMGQTGRWKLDIAGGNPPYAININWGDGTNDVISRKEAGEFIVEHKYEKAGPEENSSYTIKINGSDSDGNKASLQIFVIVNFDNLPGIATTSDGVCDHLGFTRITASVSCKFPLSTLRKLIWPVYGMVLLMAVSFYLGEREELLELRKRGALKRRRAQHP